MIFPESGWIKYINTIAAINKTAAQKFVTYLNAHDVSTAAGKKAAIDYAYALSTRYGEMAAAVSCEMYDAVAEASGVILPAAEPAATATYGEVAKMYNGMKKQNQSNEAMGNGVGRLVKRAGADTTLKNAIRDGAEFAWVPHGDTCSFCIMIASNGWRKASKKTIKGDHAEHIHANCDCTFAIRFDGKSKIEGYDPDKYRAMYDNADGDNWQEKLNSMRRDDYAQNADKIREQKREAYERRAEARSKSKGISSSGINKRTPGHGRPVNVAIESAPLTDSQKNVLERLTKYDDRDTFEKREVSMQDLAAITAHTGVEFAMFTRKGERLIIRGDANTVNILPEDGAALAKQGYRWSGHTHPGNSRDICVPSPGDRNVLRAMGQKQSSILSSTGICYVFGIDGDDDYGYTNL